MDKCRYCEVSVDDRNDLIDIDEEIVVYIDGDNFMTLQYEDGYVYDNKINYCPMCGRKL